jgi:hypothetical protein
VGGGERARARLREVGCSGERAEQVVPRRKGIVGHHARVRLAVAEERRDQPTKRLRAMPVDTSARAAPGWCQVLR